MTQVIIGLGSGRCGTRSLAYLLRQAGVDARHERGPALSWKFELNPLRHIQAGEEAGAESWADVGFYYLPHVERIRSAYPQAKFVCLRRNKSDTVRSFLTQEGRGRRWFERGGSAWSRSLPDYRGVPFAQAVSRYYDDYYRKAEQLCDQRFQIFPTEDLGKVESVRGLLRSLGLSVDHVSAGVRVTDTNSNVLAEV